MILNPFFSGGEFAAFGQALENAEALAIGQSVNYYTLKTDQKTTLSLLVWESGVPSDITDCFNRRLLYGILGFRIYVPYTSDKYCIVITPLIVGRSGTAKAPDGTLLAEWEVVAGAAPRNQHYISITNKYGSNISFGYRAGLGFYGEVVE